MKKEPLVNGGNVEAAPAARSLLRYIKEEMSLRKCSQTDAALNTFVFTCGTLLQMGVSLPQLFFCFVQLSWQVFRIKVLRRKTL